MGDVLWTDPNTRQLFVVDSRTGNSRPHGYPALERDSKQKSSNGARFTLRSRPSNAAMPVWIEDALSVRI